jgi:hypothetical protein
MVKRGCAFLAMLLVFSLLSINLIPAESSTADVSFVILSNDSISETNGVSFNPNIYFTIVLIVLVILFRIALGEYVKRNRYKLAIKVRDK